MFDVFSVFRFFSKKLLTVFDVFIVFRFFSKKILTVFDVFDVFSVFKIFPAKINAMCLTCLVCLAFPPKK